MVRILNPQNDIIFKRIFGTEKNKDILLAFLNDMLAFRNKPAIVEVLLKSPYLLREQQQNKLGIVDVLCLDSEGSHYIVEMQVGKNLYFAARAEFYVSKILSSQLKPKQDYELLKEVIFIGILNFDLFPPEVPYKNNHQLTELTTGKCFLEKQTYVFLELDKFPKKIEDVDKLEGIIEKWAYFFKYAAEMETNRWEHLLAVAPPSIQKAYDELAHSALSDEELYEYERIEKRERDHLSFMAEVERRKFEIKEIELKNEETVAKIEAKTAKLEAAKAEAEAKMAELEAKQAKIAQKMLAKGQAVAEVCELTGLSKEEVLRLQNK